MKGRDMKIGDGSRKTFHMVMGTWYDNMVVATINDSSEMTVNTNWIGGELEQV